MLRKVASKQYCNHFSPLKLKEQNLAEGKGKARDGFPEYSALTPSRRSQDSCLPLDVFFLCVSYASLWEYCLTREHCRRPAGKNGFFNSKFLSKVQILIPNMIKTNQFRKLRWICTDSYHHDSDFNFLIIHFIKCNSSP